MINHQLCGRRGFMHGMGAMAGAVAMQSLLHGGQPRQDESPLAPKKPHHTVKAKACIFLYMEGAPSHIDTFDPKPALDRLHLKEFNKKGKFVAAMDLGARAYVKSPFKFRQVGKGGLWLCEHFQQLEKVADELCVFRG